MGRVTLNFIQQSSGIGRIEPGSELWAAELLLSLNMSRFRTRDKFGGHLTIRASLAPRPSRFLSVTFFVGHVFVGYFFCLSGFFTNSVCHVF